LRARCLDPFRDGRNDRLDIRKEGITSPDYVVFYCNPGVLPEYVYHYLRSEAGRHEINLKTKGSVRFRLYYEQLAQIPIPVPADIAVQQRFVNACNRLEALRRMVSVAEGSVADCLNAMTRTAFIPQDSDLNSPAPPTGGDSSSPTPNHEEEVSRRAVLDAHPDRPSRQPSLTVADED
jgi:hypothetical protein